MFMTSKESREYLHSMTQLFLACSALMMRGMSNDTWRWSSSVEKEKSSLPKSNAVRLKNGELMVVLHGVTTVNTGMLHSGLQWFCSEA